MYIFIRVGIMRYIKEPTPAEWIEHLRLTWQRQGKRIWDKPARGPHKTPRKGNTGRKSGTSK